MIKSQAYYAYNRKKIKKIFADFITGLIDSINEDVKTFEVVTMHFEAVVGFMYGKGKVSK